MRQKHQFKTKQFEEDISDETIMKIIKLEIDDSEEAENFIQFFLDDFNMTVWCIESFNTLSLLHKVSHIVLIIQKLNKLAMDGSTIESHRAGFKKEVSNFIFQKIIIVDS